MNEFVIKVSEVLSRNVIIKADTKEEALEIAENKYKSGYCEMTKNDLEQYNLEVINGADDLEEGEDTYE